MISLKEACGVFGAISKTPYDILQDVHYGLFALQHRGEESAGFAIANGSGVHGYRNMGSVAEVMTQDVMNRFGNSSIAIGHVRYSTTGGSNIANAQPIVFKGRVGDVALAHNGNIFNSANLREFLIEKKVLFQTTIDSEVIAALINYNYKGSIVQAVTSTAKMLRGSYALVIMSEQGLVAVRDPFGIRPLVMGEKDDGTIIFASESPALDVVGARYVRDVEAGEIIICSHKKGLESFYMDTERDNRMCSFEYVYFARFDSIINGRSVYDARIKAGELLAENHYVDADLVAPVPDTASVAASAYSHKTGIPYLDVLSKNRYSGRTFIQPEQHLREIMVKMKLSAIKDNVQGKRIVLIDDSIVRGTTSKKIIGMLKEAGAKEVHLRITSPPVKHACYFGIDIQNEKELIGANHSEKEIAEILGCESVEFLTLDELVTMCGKENSGICDGCFSGCYPFEVKSKYIDKLRME